jgi:aldehyde dehydrogenase (NAD+)
VFEDANLELAATTVVRGIIQNTGQTCTAGSRLLVQQSIYDTFVALVAEKFKQVRVGTPEMNLDCGPVVNPSQQQRVNRFIEQAKAAGYPVLAQGQIAPGVPAAGYYVTPTLFGHVPNDSPLAQQEVFGPVLAAMSFTDEAQAIALANGTDYGLLAAVWSENGGTQQRVAKALKCGQVFINSFGAGGGVELPFGGVKRSLGLPQRLDLRVEVGEVLIGLRLADQSGLDEVTQGRAEGVEVVDDGVPGLSGSCDHCSGIHNIIVPRTYKELVEMV